MADKRTSDEAGRRESIDRRETPAKAPATAASAGERRGQTILREADVLDIPIPPLKGARDRRTGSRRGDASS